MFDDVRCEVDLPDGYKGGGLQTKDMGCDMATLTITKDGRLLTDGRPLWFDKAEPRDLNYHGDLNFYGIEGGPNGSYVWHEYTARFTNGKLDWIKETGNE